MGFPSPFGACLNVVVSRWFEPQLPVVTLVFAILVPLLYTSLAAYVAWRVRLAKRDHALLLARAPTGQRARVVGALLVAAMIALTTLYTVALGLYWASLGALQKTQEDPTSVPLAHAAPTLFVLFHVSASVALLGALCGMLGLWKLFVRHTWAWVEGCALLVVEIGALVVPMVFFVVNSLWMWLVDDYFGTQAPDNSAFTCAFTHNASWTPETPLLVRATCCSLTNWAFVVWLASLLLVAAIVLFWLPSFIWRNRAVADAATVVAAPSVVGEERRFRASTVKRELFASDSDVDSPAHVQERH